MRFMVGDFALYVAAMMPVVLPSAGLNGFEDRRGSSEEVHS